MLLRDGTKKMSKSDASDQSRINPMTDTIALKIRRAKTDPDPLPYDLAALEKRPRPTIWWVSTPRLQRFQRPRFSNNLEAQFSVFKPALAELLVAKLSLITAEMRRLVADTGYIDLRWWMAPPEHR